MATIRIREWITIDMGADDRIRKAGGTRLRGYVSFDRAAAGWIAAASHTRRL